MKLMTIAAAAALAVAGTFGAAVATADPAGSGTVQQIGTQGTVGAAPIVEGWTVNDLRPSSDAIPYQPRGSLWEVTATDEAIQGTVLPVIANLSARSAGGQNYQALFTVPTAQGISPFPLGQGQKTTGKVYFDVTGDTPNSVVYHRDGQDLITWVAPSSAPAPAPAPAAGPAPAPANPAPAPRPARPAPGGGPATSPGGGQGSPSTGGSQGTPSTGGSQGTPITGGSEGTPLPPGTPGNQAPTG